jgi:hypothetical protein
VAPPSGNSSRSSAAGERTRLSSARSERRCGAHRGVWSRNVCASRSSQNPIASNTGERVAKHLTQKAPLEIDGDFACIIGKTSTCRTSRLS